MKNYTKIKKFHYNMHKSGHDFPIPHLNLTMTLLGVNKS